MIFDLDASLFGFHCGNRSRANPSCDRSGEVHASKRLIRILIEEEDRRAGGAMGHGKNKQKNQKVGLGQQPKETREERRLRIEEEAKAREVRLPRLVVINKDGCVVVSLGIVSAVSLFLHFYFEVMSNSHVFSFAHLCVG